MDILSNVSSPRISIIIPVYNASSTIERTITSLQQQSISDFEIICVDDCSSDHSCDIISNIGLHDSRIRLLKNSRNIGPMETRKNGYQEARGQYIGFCDSDDILPEKAYETMILAAEKSGADIVSGNIEYIFSDARRKLIKSELRFGHDPESVYKSLLSYEFQHILCNKIFRRELLLDYPYKTFENAKRGEDACMFYQVVKNSAKTIQIPNVIYYYLENNASSSHIRLKDADISTLVRTCAFQRQLCGCYSNLSNLLYCRISRSLCAMIQQGYGKTDTFVNEIQNNGLEMYINPFVMIRHFKLADYLKINIKRYIYPLIGNEKNN